MMAKFFLSLLLLTALFATSCRKKCITPSESISTTEFSFNKINGISVASKNVIAHYSQQPEISVRVEGPSNMVESINIKTDLSGILRIELKNSDYFNVTSESQIVKVWISSPQINLIEVMDKATIMIPKLIEPYGSLDVKSFSKGRILFGEVQSSSVSIEAYERSVISFDTIIAPSVAVETYDDAIVTNNGVSIKT